MSHNDATAHQYSRGAEHELWLAMQTAYKGYTSASAALDTLTLDVSGVIPIRNSSRETHRAVAERQAAFERYIEARLQFSEEFLSALNTPGTRKNSANSVPIHDQETSAGLGIGRESRLWIVGVCVLTLCPVVLSMAYLLRDPGPTDYKMGTQFANQPSQSASTPRLPPRSKAGEHQPGTRTYVAREERMRASTQNQVQREIQKPRVRIGNARVDLSRRVSPGSAAQRASSKKRQHQALLPNHRQTHYYLFTLAPSNGYQRTGPLRLSVRSVSLQHRSFDLSVLFDGSKLDKKHVRLYERVTIELGVRNGHAELVATWIGKSRVRGYIIAPKRQKSELTAIEPRMKRSSSYAAAQALE